LPSARIVTKVQLPDLYLRNLDNGAPGGTLAAGGLVSLRPGKGGGQGLVTRDQRVEEDEIINHSVNGILPRGSARRRALRPVGEDF
ncbi:MAG: hypothetical protein ACLPND_19375, partial [Candidatus Korobacteraceae bacterium]